MLKIIEVNGNGETSFTIIDDSDSRSKFRSTRADGFCSFTSWFRFRWMPRRFPFRRPSKSDSRTRPSTTRLVTFKSCGQSYTTFYDSNYDSVPYVLYLYLQCEKNENKRGRVWLILKNYPPFSRISSSGCQSWNGGTRSICPAPDTWSSLIQRFASTLSRHVPIKRTVREHSP